MHTSTGGCLSGTAHEMGSYLGTGQRATHPYYAMHPPYYAPMPAPHGAHQQFYHSPYQLQDHTHSHPHDSVFQGLQEPQAPQDDPGMQLVLVPMWVPAGSCQPKRRRVSINGRVAPSEVGAPLQSGCLQPNNTSQGGEHATAARPTDAPPPGPGRPAEHRGVHAPNDTSIMATAGGNVGPSDGHPR